MSELTLSIYVDERTMVSIRGQQPDKLSSSPKSPYRCGCHRRPPGRFFLCDYHEGYDDGVTRDD